MDTTVSGIGAVVVAELRAARWVADAVPRRAPSNAAVAHVLQTELRGETRAGGDRETRSDVIARERVRFVAPPFFASVRHSAQHRVLSGTACGLDVKNG